MQSQTITPTTALEHAQAVIDLSTLPDNYLLTPEQAAPTIGTMPATLSVWRSTGRYALPFVKCGRKVFYKAGDLKKFIERRTRNRTGESA